MFSCLTFSCSTLSRLFGLADGYNAGMVVRISAGDGQRENAIEGVGSAGDGYTVSKVIPTDKRVTRASKKRPVKPHRAMTDAGGHGGGGGVVQRTTV